MHGLAVYVKEDLPFAWNLSLENSADSYLSFQLALIYSVSSFFSLYWLPSSSLLMVLILFHLTWMSFTRSTHLIMFLLLETSIIRTGLPFLVKLIDLVNRFIISNAITQMVNFQTWIPDCDSHSSALLNLFISSDASICSTVDFHWAILIMLLSQFPLLFHHADNRMPRFIV